MLKSNIKCVKRAVINSLTGQLQEEEDFLEYQYASKA